MVWKITGFLRSDLNHIFVDGFLIVSIRNSIPHSTLTRYSFPYDQLHLFETKYRYDVVSNDIYRDIPLDISVI